MGYGKNHTLCTGIRPNSEYLTNQTGSGSKILERSTVRTNLDIFLFFHVEPGVRAGEEGGEGVRGGEGQEEGSLHQGEELPGQALPLQASHDEGGKLPLGKYAYIFPYSWAHATTF